MNLRFIIIFALFFLATPYYIQAQAENWESLGVRKVNFGLDRDVIPVTYRDGAFTAIKIVVRNGALNMHRCVIHFENGGRQEVELRHQFGPRSASRTIDLAGNRRLIERIEFWYDSKNVRVRRATVQVFGRR